MKVQKGNKKDKKSKQEEKPTEKQPAKTVDEKESHPKNWDPVKRKQMEFVYAEQAIQGGVPFFTIILFITGLFSAVWGAFWIYVIDDSWGIHYFKTAVLVLYALFHLYKIYTVLRAYLAKRNPSLERLQSVLSSFNFIIVLCFLALCLEISGTYNSKYQFDRILFKIIFVWLWGSREDRKSIV